jgi:putative ABC transport system permease protein
MTRSVWLEYSKQLQLQELKDSGMNNLWRDFRFGFRLLRKNPGFATVAVLALALGIGANTAIYSIVHATLLEPLPYYHPNEVVMV